MHFTCFFCVFFCVYIEKDIKRNRSKLPYVGLRLEQEPRQPVFLKKRRNHYNITQKVFAVHQKRNYDISLIF